jgi:hypothetical protein
MYIVLISYDINYSNKNRDLEIQMNRLNEMRSIRRRR